MSSKVARLLALSLAGFLGAGAASAQDQIVVTNGVACQPSSNGTVYTVTQIRNDSPSNRTVYCVIPPDNIESPSIDALQIVLKNTGDVDREVTCTAKVGQPYGGGYVTASQSVVVPAGGAPTINNMVGIERNNEFAVMGFNCVLPQKVAVDVIAVVEESPPEIPEI